MLNLQATAGNASVAQLMSTRQVAAQRDPEPAATAPEADMRIAPEQLHKTVAAERDKALAGYREAGAALDVLEKAEKAGTLSPEDAEKKTQLQKSQDEHHAVLTQAESDLKLLTEPGATNQAVNDMKARRSVNTTAGPATETTESGPRLDASGLTTSSKKSVTSEVADGKSATTTSASSTTIDSTGVTNARSKSTSVVDGATTTTRQEAKDNVTKKLDVSAGDISISSTSTDKTSTSTTGGLSSSDATVRSSKIGTGGYTTSTENTVTVDDTVASSKSSTSATRGDGKVGMNKTTSSKFGTQDSQGVLTKGNETSSTVGGGAIAGAEGVGAYGSATKDLSQTHAKGVKTGQSVGMDGKFTVNVTQVPGKDPPQYQITLLINLGAKLGVSADVEKDTSDGRGFPGASGSPAPTGKSSKSASGSLSGSVTGTFVHVYSAEETKAYLAAVGANGTGWNTKEMQVLQLAAQGNIKDAQAMLSGLQGSALSASGAKGMGEGDSAEIALEGKAEGKGSFGSSTTGGFGAKGNVTLGHSESLKRSVAKKDGKIIITITAGETTTAGGGANVSYGAASGGYSGTATDTAGQSVSFTLNPDDPAYQQHFDAIANASSIESLRRLAASQPELVGSSTKSSEEGYTGTTSAGVGPASLELTDTHSYSESTTTDKTGTTRSYSGSSGGGAAASVAGGPKVSYTEKDTVATKVGPDKKASGDSSTAKSETDLTASAKNLAKNLSDKPGETLQGLFTGGAKVMQERTEVAGLKLSDADYETIAATSHDPKRWDNAAIGTVHTSSLSSWRRLARSIAQANGDRAEIGRLLARFAQENNDAAKALNHVVRPAGTAAGGARYEWPGDLAAEKAAYESLVAGDPTAPANDLETAGKHKEALDLVNGVAPKIDALVKAMQSKRDKFSDEAALAEMLAAAATRRGDVARRAATLRHQMAAAGRSAELPSADVTTVPTPEQQKAQEDIDREGGKAELEGMQASLNTYLEKQTTAFGIVQAEQAKAKAIFGSPDVIVIAKTLTDLKNNVYPQWDETLKKARDAAKKAGVDPSAIGPVPAKGWCNELNKITFGSYFL